LQIIDQIRSKADKICTKVASIFVLFDISKRNIPIIPNSTVFVYVKLAVSSDRRYDAPGPGK
jgi:hypothetical protein